MAMPGSLGGVSLVPPSVVRAGRERRCISPTLRDRQDAGETIAALRHRLSAFHEAVPEQGLLPGAVRLPLLMTDGISRETRSVEPVGGRGGICLSLGLE